MAFPRNFYSSLKVIYIVVITFSVDMLAQIWHVRARATKKTLRVSLRVWGLNLCNIVFSSKHTLKINSEVCVCWFIIIDFELSILGVFWMMITWYVSWILASFWLCGKCCVLSKFISTCSSQRIGEVLSVRNFVQMSQRQIHCSTSFSSSYQSITHLHWW